MLLNWLCKTWDVIKNIAKCDFDIIIVYLRMYVKNLEKMKIKKLNIFCYCVMLSVIRLAMNISTSLIRNAELSSLEYLAIRCWFSQEVICLLMSRYVMKEILNGFWRFHPFFSTLKTKVLFVKKQRINLEG